MRLNFANFKPLPERKYDLSSYESYPHYVTNNARREPPRWRCFVVLSPSLIMLITEIIHDHQESECYIHDILDDIFSENNNNPKN